MKNREKYVNEIIELSRLEYEILKYGQKKEYEYIARDENKFLCFYKSIPFKYDCFLSWHANSECEVLGKFLNEFFEFIKWEDEKPYLINDILERAKVVEDDN